MKSFNLNEFSLGGTLGQLHAYFWNHSKLLRIPQSTYQ